MPDASPGAIEQVTKAPMAFVDFCKKYWFAGPIIILLFLGLGMALKPWFTNLMTTKGSDGTSPATKPGDKLGEGLRSLLRISGFLLPVGFVLLGADYCFAACAGSAPCGVHGSGWVQQVFGFLGLPGVGAAVLAMLGTGVAFGISHLSAPDTFDGVSMPGQGRTLAYTPGASQELSLYLQTANRRTTPGGQPLIAVDSVVAVDTTVEQAATGTNPIQSQDLARLLDFLQISSIFHGTVLDKTTGTGPVLDLMINYVGQGFSRWGDAPSVSITVPGTETNAVPVTKYFVFPWAHRELADPAATCPWLLTLDNMRFEIGIAAAAALAAVSTDAVTTGASAVRLSTSYAVSPHWRQNYIPYARLDKPASGADGLIFQNFGGTGPSCTKGEDRMLGLAWLSKLAGLPGNLTFDTLTNLIAADFGLADVKNLDMLVLARRKAQTPMGRIGSYDLSGDGNYVQGTTGNGAARDKLLAFWLKAPSVDMVPKLLPLYNSNTKPTLNGVFSSTRTGPDAMLSLSLRELSDDKVKQQSAMSAGKMPAEYRKARHFQAKVGEPLIPTT